MITYAPYVLIFLAAFFNACMDAFENENFFESIFKKWDQKVWYKRESWKYARKIFAYKLDSWHICKSLMICCFVGAIVVYEPINEWYIDFVSMGIMWNLCFWIFYHKLFKVK